MLLVSARTEISRYWVENLNSVGYLARRLAGIGFRISIVWDVWPRCTGCLPGGVSPLVWSFPVMWDVWQESVCWCGLVLLRGMSVRKVSAGVVLLPCGGADHSSDAPASFNLG